MCHMNPKSLRCSKRPSLRQLGTVPQLSQIRLLSAPVDNPLPCSVLPPLHMRRAVDVDLRVARERPQDWGPSGCDKANQNSHGLNMRNGTQVGKPVMDGFERLKGKPTYVGVLPRNKEMGSNTRQNSKNPFLQLLGPSACGAASINCAALMSYQELCFLSILLCRGLACFIEKGPARY